MYAKAHQMAHAEEIVVFYFHWHPNGIYDILFISVMHLRFKPQHENEISLIMKLV